MKNPEGTTLKGKTMFQIAIIAIAFLNALNLGSFYADAEGSSTDYWGLIVQGDISSELIFLGDAQYMYHLMHDHYNFDGICYLGMNATLPGVTNETTKANLQWAITEWLETRSDSNDVVFIFFATHGVGYENGKNYSATAPSEQGRLRSLFDSSGDEGNETRESVIGIDVNGDNDTADWVGIDELITLKSDSTPKHNCTDDELTADLAVLNYSRLIIASTTCFGGGLVDDLSGPNRIILTVANETDPAKRLDLTGLSPWAKSLMDALHGEKAQYKIPGFGLNHTGIMVNADTNQDGHISLNESWTFAWNNNPYRLNGTDTHWLDDNGNELPNYINETDAWSGPCDNGVLAASVWFPPRHYNLTVQTYDYYYNSEIGGADIWVDSSYVDESPVMVNVSSGHVWHNVTVAPVFYAGSVQYTFHSWEDNSTSNSRLVHLDRNKTITAYYVRDWYGGGCPYLSVWNGTDYVLDNNLLRESEASNGTEVGDFYRLEQALTPVLEVGEYSLYSLLLSEFEHEHSFFDQVKLFAVDHGADTNVAVSPSGEILTYRNPQAPLSAFDDQGVDRIALIRQPEDIYYQGYSNSFLVLDFGELDAEVAKLVLRADRDLKLSIHVQTINSQSEWVNAAVVIPRTYWATEIVDLSSYLPATGEFKVRLYFTSDHKLDYVGLDTTSQAEISLQEAQLLLAFHSEEWRVTTRLLCDDDVYVELVPGQQIILLFAASSPTESRRTVIFYSRGYYYTITS